MTTTTTTTTAPSVDDRREQAWAEIHAAITAGCRVPIMVYIAADGDCASVTVTDPAHVHTWAAWLGIGPVTTRVYRVNGGTGWQRTTEVKRHHPALNIDHNVAINAPEQTEEHPR